MKWHTQQILKSQTKPDRTREILALLLKNRQISGQTAIHDFIHPPDPLDISAAKVGLAPATIKMVHRRIASAIKNQETIIVFGDYDADGITATAIMWESLYALGARILPFIPHREKHGYGLSIVALKEVIADHHPSLIVTVDNGIVAHEAAQFLKDQNIDLVITDHHIAAKTLPPALAVLHTTQLAGAGVSWFVSREICRLQKFADWRRLMQNSLDLTTIGTVADQVPLLSYNRSLVKSGLEALKKTKRPGLLALFVQADFDHRQMSTYHINFVIAPRINAMGRLAHGLDSLRLLCTKLSDKAKHLAETLSSTNQERQDLTWELLQTAKGMVGEAPNQIIVIEHTDFHEGVIGLVAGKLAETFYRPAIVIGRGETVSKASARSVTGVNIIELIRNFDSLLINAGGHPMAAGFTIETAKITQFSAAITDLANTQIDPSLLEPAMSAEVEISLSDLSRDLYQLIESLEPFGIGNPRPVFHLPDCQVLETITLGQDKKHLKLILPSPIQDQPSLEALWFGHGGDAPSIGKSVDLLATLDENTWHGHSKLQLMVKDLKGSLEKEDN